jgi:hypothetical protein
VNYQMPKETMKIPFNKPSLQLAFEAFELSYEVYDLALSFLTLVTGLEAILNREHYELRYRVSRNSAVLLGKDLDEAKAIFKGMKELYDKRSKLVHTGDRSIVSRDDVLKLRQYVREALKKVHRTGMNKDQLLTLLNTCGFGQRPWRNGE